MALVVRTEGAPCDRGRNTQRDRQDSFCGRGRALPYFYEQSLKLKAGEKMQLHVADFRSGREQVAEGAKGAQEAGTGAAPPPWRWQPLPVILPALRPQPAQ